MPKSALYGGKLRSSFNTFQLSAVIPHFSKCHSNGSHQVITCIATSAPLCHTWLFQWTAGHTAPSEARWAISESSADWPSPSQFLIHVWCPAEGETTPQEDIFLTALGLTVAQPAWSYCHFSWTQWSLWLQCGSAALSACWPAHQKPHEFYSTLAASLVMKPKYRFSFRFLSVTDDQSAVQSQCHRGC